MSKAIKHTDKPKAKNGEKILLTTFVKTMPPFSMGGFSSLFATGGAPS